jgi:hypothetical protein
MKLGTPSSIQIYCASFSKHLQAQHFNGKRNILQHSKVFSKKRSKRNGDE